LLSGRFRVKYGAKRNILPCVVDRPSSSSRIEVSKPEISVVILNRNRKRDLCECLASLAGQSLRSFEVLVADNASNDGSAEAAKAMPGVRVLRFSKNMGIAATNRAVRVAKGNYIVLLDNDMVLTDRRAFAKVVERFKKDERLGCIAFRVLDARTGEVSDNSPKFGDGDDARGYEASTFDGGGAAFRRELFDEVGGFPEEFFLYHNEVDLATRIWVAGREIRYFPDITVAHKFSTVSRRRAAFYFWWHRNYLWYFWKYYPSRPALRQTARFVLLGLRDSVRRGYFPAWLLAVLTAFAGLGTALRRRRPAPEAVQRMQAIRRKHAARQGERRRSAFLPE